MSVYRCIECEEMRDADFHGCYEHPRNDTGCVCEACIEKMEDFDFKCRFCERTRDETVHGKNECRNYKDYRVCDACLKAYEQWELSPCSCNNGCRSCLMLE